MTPFHIVYGRDPPSLLSYYTTDHNLPDISQMLQQRDQVLRQLKHNLLKAQVRMKRLADRKRCEILFEVGQWVFVKLKPCR